jgi:ATP adenylyltransferase
VPDDCAFCSEILTGRLSDPILDLLGAPTFDRIVASTPEFLVVPSLGPLNEGHILLVSTEHIECWRDATQELRAHALGAAVNLARRVSEAFDSPILIFENGTARHCTRSDNSCIDHLHIHILPLSEAHVQAVVRSLPTADVIYPAHLIQTRFDSSLDYVSAGPAGGSMTVLQAKSIERQLIRRQIASLLGSPDLWNWRDFPQLDRVLNMVSVLRAMKLQINAQEF